MVNKKDSTKKSGGNKFLLQAPKGMHDILPSAWGWWEKVEKSVKELADFYSFAKIETPILEHAQLFEKGVGAETDIVEKEMYLLKTKGGDVLALRPECTAAVMRAYMEHRLGQQMQPRRLYYEGPMFRHENPQSGRYREFHQVGFEILGGQNDPLYDAQLILVFHELFKSLKIKNLRLHLNSIGCRICRPLYKKQLQNYYRDYEKDLCKNCERRLKTNILRLLDCKEEKCLELKKNAPNFLDKLCHGCTTHFKGVLEYLDELQITYVLDNQLVRGLDYYSRTVFEFILTDGSFGTLAGGGRYDYLAELLGGHQIPAVGCAMGMERVVETMRIQEIPPLSRPAKKVFLVHVGDMAKRKSFKFAHDLFEAGIPVREALGKESLKAQMKMANREGMKLALILGQKEIFEHNIIIRDLETGLQESVAMDKAVKEIKERLKGK